MRNLRNISHGVFRAPPTASAIAATCWDAARDEILIAYGPTAGEPRIELVRLCKDPSYPSSFHAKNIATWEPSNNGLPDTIRRLHHSSDTLTTCVVMAGGDIVTVTEPNDGVDAHVEIVGTLDSSVAAVRWSPDDELLVLVTGEGKAIFMSRDFDVITETNFSPDDLRRSKHVSVGWGKKETQFQGKGAKAKALRDPTIPEKVDEGTASSQDDGRCSISWRGDGAYVAINHLQEGARRVIRVFSRDGELDSVSEPVDGLEGSLSWRPEGNLVAGVQRLAGRVDIIFFERNGLRHGQFSLRASKEVPDALDDLSLEWNTDSTVLAIAMKDRVQLWTMGNYHWYLKQEILCGPYDGRAPEIVWHAEKPLKTAVITSDAIFFDEYCLTVAGGPAVPPHDHGAVAVIDGQTVKFTPFRTANVPPPMAMAELELEWPAIDVAFAGDCSSLAVLHQAGVDVYTLEPKGLRLSKPKLVRSITIDRVSVYEECPLQVAYSGSSEIVVLQGTDLEHRILMHDLGNVSNTGTQWLEIWGGPITTVFSSNGGTIGLDRLGGLSHISAPELTPLRESFPTYMPWASFVPHGSELLVFGLSRNGQLYANSRQLAKNCTSFLTTPSHLIFTTSSHLLKFVHLDTVEDLEVPLDDPEIDERCRSVERGARLVTAMPTRMSLVLQMPRGNLETIYPRAMVLAGIRKLVEGKDYAEAFATCRTQRVDMNILYDHRPSQFLDSVSLFLGQVKDAANIDLFLSTLKEEDVTKAMYRDTKSLTAHPYAEPETTSGDKINTVCNAVLQKLLTQKNANLQNIITAHVCKNPPALDDGLRVVAELMEEDEVLAEQAVEHICFLVDVNKLFDHALGLYNLDLTLLVSQQSQRDPREYLPFIQELHRMPALNRQFTIDDKLGRKEKALAHLQNLNNFTDVEKYVVKHSLYQHALGLYRHDEQRHKRLTDLYAAHLKSISRFREAGLAYESLGNFPEAVDCYLKAGVACWRECLYVAQQEQDPPISSEKLQQIASTLADALREAKDYAAAATIHVEYLDAIEAAIQCFCKGYLFADAMRLVTLHKRPELLQSAIDPGLSEAFSSSTEFMADCKAQLKAQVPRIAELRKKAHEDPLAFYEGEYGRQEHIPDDVSIAASSRLSTSASLFTRYTGKAGSVGTVGSNVSRATSKNRKREEKKRARGRKGTVYEEEYLVNSVRRLVERVESTKGEIQRLVFGLARRGMSEQARTIEMLAGQVIEACRNAIREIWGEKAGGGLAEDEGQDPAVKGEDGTHRAFGGQGVLQESLEAMKAKQEPPVLSDFARLELLCGNR